MRGNGAAWLASIGVATTASCALVLGIDGHYENAGEGGKGGATVSSSSSASSGGAGGAPVTSSGGAGGTLPTGPLGTVGAPCAPAGAVACKGYAQAGRVECDSEDHTWHEYAACVDQNCDTAHGGACADVKPQCVGQMPGHVVCEGKEIKACGADLVDLVPASPQKVCPYLCTEGACTGECSPDSKECGTADHPRRVCNASAEWEDTPCQEGTPLCNAQGDCDNPTSCVEAGPGLTNCPSTCCTSKLVKGDWFNRSSDPSYPAKVSTFLLDRYEITVGRFRQFVNAYPGNKPMDGAGAHPKIPGSGWQSDWSSFLPADANALKSALSSCDGNMFSTWTTSATNDNRPMNCITWYEAFAFCAWDGGRLPTEAEWNYAAAGGGLQRPYPWGTDAPKQSLATFQCTGDMSGPQSCAASDILSVGQKGAGDGHFGQADLAGSVAEWTLDAFVNYLATCIDCASLGTSADARVIRGGGWNTKDLKQLLTSDRESAAPTSRRANLGARCARSP